MRGIENALGSIGFVQQLRESAETSASRFALHECFENRRRGGQRVERGKIGYMYSEVMV